MHQLNEMYFIMSDIFPHLWLEIVHKIIGINQQVSSQSRNVVIEHVYMVVYYW